MNHQQLVNLANALIAQLQLHATVHIPPWWTSFQVGPAPYRLFIHSNGVAWNGGQRFEIQMNADDDHLPALNAMPGVAACIQASNNLTRLQNGFGNFGNAGAYRRAVRFTPNATPAQIQAVLTAALTDAYYP